MCLLLRAPLDHHRDQPTPAASCLCWFVQMQRSASIQGPVALRNKADGWKYVGLQHPWAVIGSVGAQPSVILPCDSWGRHSLPVRDAWLSAVVLKGESLSDCFVWQGRFMEKAACPCLYPVRWLRKPSSITPTYPLQVVWYCVPRRP